MISRPQILLIEDEVAIADTLRYVLSVEGFDTHWCADGRTALACFQERPIDLVLLDVGLPDVSGFELFRLLQSMPTGPSTPMVFLTARNSELDTVVGLELGADDYIAKPFSPRELVARIRTILRRRDRHPAVSSPLGTITHSPTKQTIDFVLQVNQRRITAQGQVLDLSRYEHGLLALLLQHPGRVFSRNELLELIWDDPSEPLDRTVDAHIKTLRAKLKAINGLSDCIKTLRGVGYAFDDTLGLQVEVI